MDVFVKGIKVKESGQGFRASTRSNHFSAWGWTEAQAIQKLKETIEREL